MGQQLRPGRVKTSKGGMSKTRAWNQLYIPIRKLVLLNHYKGSVEIKRNIEKLLTVSANFETNVTKGNELHHAEFYSSYMFAKVFTILLLALPRTHFMKL